MKTQEQVLVKVENRVRRTWTDELAAAAAGTPAAEWPYAFSLTAASGAELTADFVRHRDWAEGWTDWVRNRPAAVRRSTRIVAGTRQQMPTHLEVASLDDAAALLGSGWPERVDRARDRTAIVWDQFPAARPTLGRMVRELADLSAVDFELLLTAARWFASHEGVGLTPRQVPVEGLHAKWLNSRQHLVAALAGREDLGLLPPHPPRIHFTYLDPGHLAAGCRRHDSVTLGDVDALSYRPRVVIISENKDTAVHFPSLPGGIAVEGDGFGGKTAAALDWVANAPVLLYWGDLDAQGFEILDGYRRDGVPVASLLMDEDTYRAYARFGVDTDAHNKPLTTREPRSTPHLTAAERSLYERLCGSNPPGPRRIEQERIPLETALAAVRSATTLVAAC